MSFSRYVVVLGVDAWRWRRARTRLYKDVARRGAAIRQNVTQSRLMWRCDRIARYSDCDPRAGGHGQRNDRSFPCSILINRSLSARVSIINYARIGRGASLKIDTRGSLRKLVRVHRRNTNGVSRLPLPLIDVSEHYVLLLLIPNESPRRTEDR